VIDLGDSYRLTITIKDSTGTLVDASPLTLNIALPDQTSVGPFTPIHDSTGNYHYSYLTVQAGRHVAKWAGTIGTDQFAHTDVFDVEVSADISLISLDSAKKQVQFKASDNDDELRGFLLSASENIEGTCGICAVRSFTSRVGAAPYKWTPSLRLPNVPVVSVTSLTPVYSWSPAVSTSEITTRLSNGKITRLDGWEFWGEYDVTYVAGRAVVPPSLRTACAMVVQHLWRTRRGPANVPGGVTADTTTLPGWGYAIPNQAAELISGFTIEMYAA
jgi:hypothetical protein